MRQATIRVAQPCQENWAAMAPTTAGRHCAACASEVIDFTQKTDAEILAHLAKAAGRRICGRFAAGQLERPLQRAVPATPTARWRAWLAAAVAVWGLRESVGTELKAQVPIEMRKMDEAQAVPEQWRVSKAEVVESRRPSPRTINGVVRDVTTNEGLPGVTVILKGTGVGVSTDSLGQFRLPLPAGYDARNETVLYIQYLGYETQEQQVVGGSEAPDVQVFLHIQTSIGLPALRPLPWHPREFFYWSKYWLTRPFHRS